MNEHSQWWEPIFSGQLEVGIDKEKMTDVDKEDFLYFREETETEFHS